MDARRIFVGCLLDFRLTFDDRSAVDCCGLDVGCPLSVRWMSGLLVMSVGPELPSVGCSLYCPWILARLLIVVL